MIIDAHTHLHGSVTSERSTGGEGAFCKALERAGIDRAIVAGLDSLDDNLPILHAAHHLPERVIPFAYMDPKNPQPLGTDWCGIGEIYLQCGSVELPREYMRKTVDIARERKIPILMHSGEYSYTAPFLIGGLAKTFPDVTWIIGHMGSLRYAFDTIEILRRYSNVYADTSGMSSPQILYRAVLMGCAGRILFGSDYPIWDPIVERTRIEAAKLDSGVKRLILGENAARLFAD